MRFWSSEAYVPKDGHCRFVITHIREYLPAIECSQFDFHSAYVDVRSVDYIDAAKGTSFQQSVDADLHLEEQAVQASGVRDLRSYERAESKWNCPGENGIDES